MEMMNHLVAEKLTKINKDSQMGQVTQKRNWFNLIILLTYPRNQNFKNRKKHEKRANLSLTYIKTFV
jgi:hypothetical protein